MIICEVLLDNLLYTSYINYYILNLKSSNRLLRVFKDMLLFSVSFNIGYFILAFIPSAILYCSWCVLEKCYVLCFCLLRLLFSAYNGAACVHISWSQNFPICSRLVSYFSSSICRIRLGQAGLGLLLVTRPRYNCMCVGAWWSGSFISTYFGRSNWISKTGSRCDYDCQVSSCCSQKPLFSSHVFSEICAIIW